MMIDYRAFQPLTLICWTVAACSIIVTNLIAIGPAHPAFWLVVALIACQIAGYLYYRHKWPNSVWRPGAPVPIANVEILRRPATKADLDAALQRQRTQIIIWFSAMIIIGTAAAIILARST